ncbi:MAG: menaquinone biosynthesis protein [Deltaproteobacteria bacterium]|nr:menaquinone biosynthesis protein [Deltaproteobacteria bacterium]
MASESCVRIGAVSYLNAKPLIYTLPQNNPNIQLSTAVPSRLADQLKAGQLDVALIPAIECFRHSGYRIIKNISISSHGAVRSVKLFSKTHIHNIQRVALDISSRTSRALVKILLAEKYGLRPQYTEIRITNYELRITNKRQEHAGDLLSMGQADAVLLIGDAAMQQSEKGLYILDLGAEWQAMTNRPFVYALWVARENVILSNIPQRLQQAKKEGMKLIPEIASIEAPKLNLPESFCREYLTQNIGYDLDDAELDGLRLFYNYAVKFGLAEPGIEIVFA